MVKLCDVIFECGFDHAVETEIVKFLFLTHNQNSHVREELLKNMKDGDSFNTILGYAKHVESTQHSEHLSKVYLDTIKIPNANVKVEAISQNIIVPTKETILNIGLKARVSPIKATVVIVVQIIHQRSVLLTGKHVIHAIKMDILSCVADPDRGVKARMVNGGLIQINKDNPDGIIMKLQQTTETKVTTQTGSNMNRTLRKYCSVEVYIQTLNQTFSLMKLTVKKFNVCLLT